MNRFFIRVLVTGGITLLMLTIVSLGWIVSQSSISLLTGGVNTFPQATAFIPKQAPGMVSLLTNPEKLYGLRQATLSLNQRQSDRQEWQGWITDIVSKIGLDYQRDLKPWLGDEITLAITALDYDRNLDNGTQAGYLLATAIKNSRLAQESLQNFYDELDHASVEQYKGADIIYPPRTSSKTSLKEPDVWARAVVGDFVLYANYPQIIKEAINQAQAVNLNLEQSDSYQTAISTIKQPHIGLSYIDIPQTSAWLDKLGKVKQSRDSQTLTTWLTVSGNNLLAQTFVSGVSNAVASSQAYRSLINNPELEQIFDSLLIQDNTYIDLTEKTPLLSNQVPLYEVTRLAIKALFPHLRMIAIENKGNQDNVSHAQILFKLDA
jgi:hypothetical protein